MVRIYKSAWPNSEGRRDDTLYQRSRVHWSQQIWYGSQRDLFAEKRARERGRQFELHAAEHVFCSLNIHEVTDLCGIVSSAPFDFVGTYGGRRVVIDVTTKWQKRVDAKVPLAAALGFPLYLLMISPRDRTSFYFVEVRPEARSVRVPFELLRNMADKLGEVRHGRK